MSSKQVIWNVLEDLENVVGKLIKFWSNVGGADKTFRTFSYTTKLIQWLFELQYGKNHDSVKRLQNISAVASDWRYLTRFFNDVKFIHMLITMKQEDKFLQLVKRIQLIILIVYTPVEHYFFLSKKGVIKMDTKVAARLSRFCSKCWLACVLLDIIGYLYIVYHNSKKRIETTDEKEKQKLDKEWNNAILSLTCDACDLPIALNGAVSKAPLPPLLSSTLGIIGSVIGFKMKWKEMF